MPKIGREYSMYNKEEKHVERTQHTQREENIGFFDMLNQKHVEAKLTTGEILTGIFESNPYNRYDVLLRCDEGLYVVRKDVLEYVKLWVNSKGGDRK